MVWVQDTHIAGSHPSVHHRQEGRNNGGVEVTMHFTRCDRARLAEKVPLRVALWFRRDRAAQTPGCSLQHPAPGPCRAQEGDGAWERSQGQKGGPARCGSCWGGQSTGPWVTEVMKETGSPGGIGTPTCTSQHGTEHRLKERRVRKQGHECQISFNLPDVPKRDTPAPRVYG